ncbi:oxygenase MpaB family protein [Nocardia sp. NPDC005978]|uniref:oxygenase MpaB family protein n=1 Tax=unclassified Nocardia TaxID=2637762 RepID=UPI0033AABCA5
MTIQSAHVSSPRKSSTRSNIRLAAYGDRTRPGSALHKMLSDGSAVYAIVPAFVYVVLSEAGGKGVDDHDRVAKIANRDSVRMEDLLVRLIDSLDLVIGLAFADDEERAAIGHAIWELHRHIEGTLDDGTPYHAWNRELWSWTWAGILKPVMDSYEELRGPLAPGFLQDAYVGWLQLGDLIGVKGLPEDYAEFLRYWREHWKPVALDTGAGRFIMSQVYSPILPGVAPWLPGPVWNTLMWPALNLLRTSTFIVMDPEVQELVGMKASRAQQLSIRAHRAVWNALPARVTGQWAGTYLRLRLRYGNTSWKRHYSAESLARYRDGVKDAKTHGDIAPDRPSKRH